MSLWNLFRTDPSRLPPLTLAYVGDAVFELYVRTSLLAGDRPRAGNLHRETVELVRAEAQARALEAIRPLLSEEEADLVRRARNQKSGRGAEYARSTGFEALIGWLYLSGRHERLEEILKASLATRPEPPEGGH